MDVSPDRPAPQSLRDLFVAFTLLSLQGFGGVLPVAQRELVERRRWLSREQFVEMLAVCHVLPGPNIVNLSLMIGDRAFGTRGALTAMAGMLLVPMGVVLALTGLYAEFASVPAVSGALRGMGAVAAGLAISNAVKLLGTLRRHALGLPLALTLAAATALATGWLQWPLVWVLLGLGLVACSIAGWRLVAAAKLGAAAATPETSTKKTATKKTATKEPATKEPATPETATKEAATKEAATNETATNETAKQETPTPDPSTLGAPPP